MLRCLQTHSLINEIRDTWLRQPKRHKSWMERKPRNRCLGTKSSLINPGHLWFTSRFFCFFVFFFNSLIMFQQLPRFFQLSWAPAIYWTGWSAPARWVEPTSRPVERLHAGASAAASLTCAENCVCVCVCLTLWSMVSIYSLCHCLLKRKRCEIEKNERKDSQVLFGTCQIHPNQFGSFLEMPSSSTPAVPGRLGKAEPGLVGATEPSKMRW